MNEGETRARKMKNIFIGRILRVANTPPVDFSFPFFSRFSRLIARPRNAGNVIYIARKREEEEREEGDRNGKG